MKTLARFIVFFFLALGLARADVENAQPEAYMDRVLPGVMIVMKLGNTLWGTCLQIELDGNLPIERVSDHVQCMKMVAENHTGLTGDAALEAAKKIQAGTAVFFPFNVSEIVLAVATKDKEIATQIAEIGNLERELAAKARNEAATRVELDLLKSKVDSYTGAVARILAINAGRPSEFEWLYESPMRYLDYGVNTRMLLISAFIAVIAVGLGAMRSEAQVASLRVENRLNFVKLEGELQAAKADLAAAEKRRNIFRFAMDGHSEIAADFEIYRYKCLGCGTDDLAHPIQHLRNAHFN